MDKIKINESRTIERDGDFYCLNCGRIKDDSGDDCECIDKFPMKRCELEEIKNMGMEC